MESQSGNSLRNNNASGVTQVRWQGHGKVII